MRGARGMLVSVVRALPHRHGGTDDDKDTGGPLVEAVLSGGGSRSPHWPQMFADGIGIPITTAEARETGALGAAIGAGVGIGLFDTYETGIAAMTRPRDTFMPDVRMRTHYDRRYALFGRTREAMRAIWTDLRQETATR